MNNRNVERAWEYHEATKHSYMSIRSRPHYLDWGNQPSPFKVYPKIDVLPLPRQVRQTRVPALSAIADIVPASQTQAVPDLTAVAQMLYFSAGITRRRAYPGGEIFFRAAACTGALYEIELYVVCADLPDLGAGLYHFAPAEFSLHKLREGDYRHILMKAAGDEPAVSHAPLTIICTGIYWRNAWKYQARTYRHFGWDNGTILANLLAIATAMRLPAKLVCGFVDEDVNRLLDLDTQREVAFSMIPVGRMESLPREVPLVVAPLEFQMLPSSKKEVDYPSMREVHAASSLQSKEEVSSWRASIPPQERSPGATTVTLIRLQSLSDSEMPSDAIEDVILRRGSARRFRREPISFVQLSTMLERATRGVPADFLDSPKMQLNDLYLIVHAIEGLKPGAYYFDRERQSLECLKEGDFRDQAGYLGLEQELPADASVAIFFLAELRRILERFGNRGYRAAQLEAGIIGGKLYLAAYAQQLAATGLTFYDDDVVKFFSPHAEGKAAIFLVALGKSARRSELSD
jgi:SagB-type dehydrogenase family enzyme